MTEPISIEDAEDAFSQAMADRGYGEHAIPADAQWHNFAFPDGSSGKKGSAKLKIANGSGPEGVVKDFRSDGLVFVWKPGIKVEVDAAHVARVTAAAEADRAARERVRSESMGMFNRLPAATADHPYLVRKKITYPHPLRLNGDNLVVPIYSSATGEFQAIQFIGPDGAKDAPWQSTMKAGCMMPGSTALDRLNNAHQQCRDPIVIAEGYATAESIRQATGHHTIAAMSRGQLKAVAVAISNRFPLRQIIIATDDETKKEEGRTDHPGIDSARDAARAVGNGLVAYPSRGDFNDVFVHDGPEKVKAEIAAAIEPPAAEPDASADSPQSEAPKDADVAALNERYAVVLVGDKACILKTDGRGVSFLNLSAFDEWHANRFVMRGEKIVPLAKYWRRHAQRRQYEGVEFAPGGGRPGHFNLWRGLAVEPRPGDCSKFLAHLRDNVCTGNTALFNWVFGWFAQIAQHPDTTDKKTGTSLVLRGPMGSGKTKVGEVFGSLFGDHYTLVSDPRYVTGRFNSHMAQLLILHADEAFWAGDRSAEGKLKDLVTGHHHYIEMKGKEPIRVRNHIRLFVTGNPDWLVPAGFEERRFAILDMGTDHVQDIPYFAAIDEEMNSGGREALLYELLNFDLSTVDLRTIPRTAALLEQQIATATPEQAWWLDVLNRGDFPNGPTEKNTCFKDDLFNDYIAHANKQGVRRKQIETTIGMALQKFVGPGLAIGRETYPGYENSGRTVNAKRPRFYRFPPLKECRKRFAQMMRRDIPWEEPDGEWTQRGEPPT